MSSFLKKSFDSSKCLSLLDVTKQRIGILRKKRSIIAKQSRADVAKLLERGQDANAAARAEHVFREENVVGAYELLEQHCEIVIKGIRSIKSKKECSLELKEAIASLIYASPRCGDLQELQKLRDVFISRFGAEYVTAILELQPGCAVNTQIIQKLSSRPPNSDVRLNLLKEIATEYKVNWNYQRAVAASFNHGEASEKPKVSPSVSLASKQGVTDDALPSASVDAKSKEAAASLAAQKAMPAKASMDKAEPLGLGETNKHVDVSGNSMNRPGQEDQASPVRHKSAPSMVHDIRPRERDKGSIGSPTTDDKFIHQDGSKGNASLVSRNSAPSIVHKFEPRKEDFVDTQNVSPAEKQKWSSSWMHPDDELKGHANSKAKNADHLVSSKEVLDVGPTPKLKPASVYPVEESGTQRASSGLHTAVGNKALPSRRKASPVQLSDARLSVSPTELGGPMQQAASETAFHQAKVSSRKPESHFLASLQADGIGESLAAKQYVRAHQSYVEVDAATTEEETQGKNFSQIKFPSQQQGVVDPVAYDAVDAHVESMAINNLKDYKNVHRQAESSSKARNREERSDFNTDYATGQSKGTHHQKMSSRAEIHERSRGLDRNLQARNQHEENWPAHHKYSTGAGSNTKPSIPPSELMSMKVDVDQELADLETAIASAARAADAAVDMVRTCSIRSRADKKGRQQEHNSHTHKRETHYKSREAFHNTLNQQNNFARDELHAHSTHKGDLDHKEPYQEQEPVSLDSEMPQFDDSSDESIAEDLPLHRESRRSDPVHVDLRRASNMSTKASSTAIGAQGRNHFGRESLHVFAKRNSQEETLGDGHAESIYSFSPKSSSSSHQHSNSDVYRLHSNIHPSHNTRLDEYEEPDNVRGWIAALPSRNTAYAADEKISSGWHGVRNEGIPDKTIEHGNVDKGMLRWDGSSTGDTGKKLTLGNGQLYKQHNVKATQTNAGKFQGVSRRSVRPVGPT